jgi:hypothetical protein
VNPLAKTILDAALRTGSGVVKDIVTAKLGPTIGGLAGTVIDGVAKELGVEPAAIPTLPDDDLDKAVAAVNDDPELLRLYIEQQQEANRLMLAEMDKGGTWTWAWRPFWMWLLAGFWTYALVLQPLVNAVSGGGVAAVPFDMLTTLTGAYLALYMGGHTVKTVFGGK